MKNIFDFIRRFFRIDRCKYEGVRRKIRIDSGTPTEFFFCNRRFGAVILDTSNTGMKLVCDIRLGIGSILTFTSPAISGKVVWRDDAHNLMGIRFVNKDCNMQDKRLPTTA